MYSDLNTWHRRPSKVEIDCNINDPAFADAVTGRLLEYLGKNHEG